MLLTLKKNVVLIDPKIRMRVQENRSTYNILYRMHKFHVNHCQGHNLNFINQPKSS